MNQIEEINKSIVNEIASLIVGFLHIEPLKVRSIAWDCENNQVLVNAVVYDCRLGRFDTCCKILNALNFDRSNAGGGVYRVDVALGKDSLPEAQIGIQWVNNND